MSTTEDLDLSAAQAPLPSTVVTVTNPPAPKICGKPCSRWVRRDGINGAVCDDCGARKPRGTRSDSGTKRAPKPAPAPADGKLNREQSAHLGKLAMEIANARQAVMQAKDQLAGAEEHELQAQSVWFKYLAEITQA